MSGSASRRQDALIWISQPAGTVNGARVEPRTANRRELGEGTSTGTSTSNTQAKTSSELSVKGQAIRRKMSGEEALAKANARVNDNPITKQFGDLATKTVFGACVPD